MTREKPEVGQTLYSLPVGNAARRRVATLTPVTVIKVGRKYFTTAKEQHIDSHWMHTKYHLDTWVEKTEYCPDSCLYLSHNELADERESIKLTQTISAAFGISSNRKHLRLESLKQIVKIIGE